MPTPALRADVLYRVRSADPSVFLALKPHVVGDGPRRELRWFDTLRGRTKPGAFVPAADADFAWQTPDGTRYAFSVVHLDEYEREVRDRLERRPAFADEAAMHAFFVTHLAGG